MQARGVQGLITGNIAAVLFHAILTMTIKYFSKAQ
jgi:hypothetical protein